MPCGSLPSIAALTRAGARNASEIILLTFLALHFSRFAMLSVVADGSVISSSSQCRPRAINATSVARVSERMGRAFWSWTNGGSGKMPRASLIRENGFSCPRFDVVALRALKIAGTKNRQRDCRSAKATSRRKELRHSCKGTVGDPVWAWPHPLMQISGRRRATRRARPACSAAATTAPTSL